MFALVLFDKSESKVIIARDPLGIKPLYYCIKDGDFFYASELKALFSFSKVEKKISNDAIYEFFLQGFLLEPDTGFVNVYKVPPAQFISIDLNQSNLELNFTKYWHLNGKKKYTELALESQVNEEINNHLIADVPIGLYFSGGIDSSILFEKIGKRVKSLFFIVDKTAREEAGQEDDYYYANKIANDLNLQFESVEFREDQMDFLGQIEFIAKKVEEPISDFTFISSYAIANVAKGRQYKVMLSGMGADELFCGYDRYKVFKYSGFLQKFELIISFFGKKIRSFKKKFERLDDFFLNSDNLYKYSRLIGVFSRSEIDEILDKNYNSSVYEHKVQNYLNEVPNFSQVKKAMYIDLFGFLSHNFMVADKSTMLASVELRVPLATKKLAEMAFSFEDKSLLDLFTTKKLLKKILAKKVDRSLVYRKKTGFNPPLDNKIAELKYEEILSCIVSSKIDAILNIQAIKKILNEHFSGERNNTYKIYNLLFISYWYKHN
jgi:asparagine synthase (glutamine-hydrolysing)